MSNLAKSVERELRRKRAAMNGEPCVDCGSRPMYYRSPMPCFNQRAVYMPPRRSAPLPSGCESSVGGSNWAYNGQAAYDRTAGGVRGTFDQIIQHTDTIAPTKVIQDFTGTVFSLPTADQAISKSRGKSIAMLSLIAAVDGPQAAIDAFDLDFFLNATKILVRQGSDLLYEPVVNKLRTTDQGLPGLQVVINPEPAAFGDVTFQLVGLVKTDGSTGFDLNSIVTVQWGPFQTP